jgi:hypothetical protein
LYKKKYRRKCNHKKSSIRGFSNGTSKTAWNERRKNKRGISERNYSRTISKKTISLDDLYKIVDFFNENLKNDIRDFYLDMDAERVDSSDFEFFNQSPEKWPYDMKMTMANFLTTISFISKTYATEDKGAVITNLVKAMSLYGSDCVFAFHSEE